MRQRCRLGRTSRAAGARVAAMATTAIARAQSGISHISVRSGAHAPASSRAGTRLVTPQPAQTPLCRADRSDPSRLLASRYRSLCGTDRRRHWHDCGASSACRWIRRASQPCDSSTECTRPARPLPIVASEPSNATTVPASPARHSRGHSRPVTGGRSTRGDSASCPCSRSSRLCRTTSGTLSLYNF